MVAIFVQDPTVMPSFPEQAFAELYGLTRSELRVLLAMVPGLSVKEAAEVLGVGENTAKTHLQHIHSKTKHFEADRAYSVVHEFHPAGQCGLATSGPALAMASCSLPTQCLKWVISGH